jgi:hypothetical protein
MMVLGWNLHLQSGKYVTRKTSLFLFLRLQIYSGTENQELSFSKDQKETRTFRESFGKLLKNPTKQNIFCL